MPLAKLRQPLDDGTTQIIIKHSEDYMKSKPDFPVPLRRCRIEASCFQYVSEHPVPGPANSVIRIRAPKFFDFQEEHSNQMLEYMANSITFNDYILKYCDDNPPTSLKSTYYQTGKSLGSWIKGFSELSKGSPGLPSLAKENVEAKQIRYMVNFGWLTDRAEDFPDGLGDAKEIFSEVQKMVIEEMQDESKLQCVHGDYALANLILSNAGSVFVIDWEITHLSVPNEDLGQMIAELYAFWLYKSVPVCLWMLDGLIDAYGEASEEFAFRTAVQVGSYIVCVTYEPGKWGTPEQVERTIVVGKEILVHAWKKDRAWFDQSELACIFRHAI